VQASVAVSGFPFCGAQRSFVHDNTLDRGTDDRVTALSSAATLVESVARGSRLALKRLYDLESRRLYGIALRIVRRPEVAADVLQEAFIQIWQNARSYSQERGAAEAWLTGIVRFRALDAVRKTGREVLSGDVIERIGAEAEASALRRCLGNLDDVQRRSVVLAFVDGYSHAEIAARIAEPLGTVKSRIRRGLAALKKCLES
jgi:RNA polymerase sigma-70 factor (ECF subfamily)